jgi:hypothetical protein
MNVFLRHFEISVTTLKTLLFMDYTKNIWIGK